MWLSIWEQVSPNVDVHTDIMTMIESSKRWVKLYLTRTSWLWMPNVLSVGDPRSATRRFSCCFKIQNCRKYILNRLQLLPYVCKYVCSSTWAICLRTLSWRHVDMWKVYLAANQLEPCRIVLVMRQVCRPLQVLHLYISSSSPHPIPTFSIFNAELSGKADMKPEEDAHSVIVIYRHMHRPVCNWMQ